MSDSLELLTSLVPHHKLLALEAQRLSSLPDLLLVIDVRVYLGDCIELPSMSKALSSRSANLERLEGTTLGVLANRLSCLPAIHLQSLVMDLRVVLPQGRLVLDAGVALGELTAELWLLNRTLD